MSIIILKDFINMKTNLVIVAHPDDEILGLGATGYKLVKKGLGNYDHSSLYKSYK